MSRTTTFSSLLLIAFALLLVSCKAGAVLVAPAEAAKRIATGNAILVDVRELNEWKETGVPAPAHLLALSDLKGERKEWKRFLEENRDKELLLICRTGNRSGQAAALLAKEGYKTSNAGGFSGWQKAGMPTRTFGEPRR